jgi:transcription antitermination protein NusB
MNISLRSKAREFAMQMLFQWEMSPQDSRKLAATFWRGAVASEDTEIFADQLFHATVRTVKDLDEVIEKHCENWRFERIAAIDRAILRLALHELALAKTPSTSVINEAVKLAKKYSSEDSARFVNGILDAVVKARVKSSAHRSPSTKAKAATDPKSG